MSIHQGKSSDNWRNVSYKVKFYNCSKNKGPFLGPVLPWGYKAIKDYYNSFGNWDFYLFFVIRLAG